MHQVVMFMHFTEMAEQYPAAEKLMKAYAHHYAHKEKDILFSVWSVLLGVIVLFMADRIELTAGWIEFIMPDNFTAGGLVFLGGIYASIVYLSCWLLVSYLRSGKARHLVMQIRQAWASVPKQVLCDMLEEYPGTAQDMKRIALSA